MWVFCVGSTTGLVERVAIIGVLALPRVLLSVDMRLCLAGVVDTPAFCKTGTARLCGAGSGVCVGGMVIGGVGVLFLAVTVLGAGAGAEAWVLAAE